MIITGTFRTHGSWQSTKTCNFYCMKKGEGMEMDAVKIVLREDGDLLCDNGQAAGNEAE